MIYLGNDLNPSAVSSLAEDAKKLNAQADQLFKSVDEVTRVSREYILSLKPE